MAIDTANIKLEFSRDVQWTKQVPKEKIENFKVTVVGAGLSVYLLCSKTESDRSQGITAGIMLKRLGIPFVIIERLPDMGGTWFVIYYI